ncbi:hypothetical protein [Spongiibacter tropicus]|uniref:hypothetical protein n=1 Tax=Spongiibacter tropicus TaxID=454602 RepID=UPI0035BE3E99
MSKYVEKVEREVRVYIHNDLSNAAYHLKENVLRIKKEGEAGISLHILGALTLYAFTFEAKINFLGSKLNPDWKERQSFHKKLEEVFRLSGIEMDKEQRPLSSLLRLKEFRDIVAHGKPVENREEYEQIVDRGDRDELELHYPAPHDEYCELEYLLQVDEDLDNFWETALKAAGIELYETLTHFSGGRTYLREADET